MFPVRRVGQDRVFPKGSGQNLGTIVQCDGAAGENWAKDPLGLERGLEGLLAGHFAGCKSDAVSRDKQ